MEASDWNIVILGHWNRAILTPNWIAERIFELPPGTPVDVLVPLDGFAPFQVQNGGITVVPLPGQLLIQLGTPTKESLATGLSAMIRSVEALPQTPFRACGINLRFVAAEPPAGLLERTRSASEKLLSDAGYELRTRRRGETLAFREGTLNIVADIPTAGECRVTVNFDRQATSMQDIVAWLKNDPAEYIAEATKVIGLLAD